jgi:hypothetical protein
MRRGIWLALAATTLFAQALEDTLYIPLDHPAIQYSAGSPRDPVGRLEEKIEKGTVKLDYAGNGWGYLPSLLKQLQINVDSQALVFSKGSIQNQFIGPRTPRAIYFNDEASVGYVQNGEQLELAGLDPKQGVYFYTLNNEKSDHPELVRRDDCLRCHQGPITFGVPGVMVSSVHPRAQGNEGHGGAFVTDDRIPLAERWGGWYVTGTTGSQTHLGNNINLYDPVHPGGETEDATQNLTTLTQFFATSRYLAPTSDLVALMTLEHQTRMTNLLTRIGWDARIALHDKTPLQKLDSEIEQTVRYMLFCDEAPLREPVAGVSTFTKTFPERGPRDSQGRSLRDLDLHTRLFRYPLSYMIYSAAFDALPDPVRDRVYRRIYDVLSGKDQSAAYKLLSPADRRAILEIVRATKTNLPPYWMH